MGLRSQRYKEMPVIPVIKVVGPKKNNQKKWRAEEEERHKGSLTTPPKKSHVPRGQFFKEWLGAKLTYNGCKMHTACQTPGCL
jgi:hypothetical protein